MTSPVRMCAAHPRSRGENDSSFAFFPKNCGSSPLTRGKLRRHRRRVRRERLIPAHAGKTGRAGQRVAGLPAHPRSRGENADHDRPANRSTGSSPLTRGKPDGLSPLSSAARLIPAHAGKTDPPIDCRSRRTAHPRSRGENRSRRSSPSSRRGSSPLTRGKRRGRTTPGRPPRLIPAHAGKTPNEFTHYSSVTAHPRSRGENAQGHILTRSFEGSSPLTRGKPFGS